jgi:hypothetical protein
MLYSGKIASSRSRIMSETNGAGGDDGSNRFIPTEQRETIDSMRREGDDRRQEEDPFDNGEKREPPERRDGPERRKISLEVPCKTSGTIDAIEDWLDDNCDDYCRVVLQRVSHDRSIKHLLVMFETEADRDRFLEKYLKKNE